MSNSVFTDWQIWPVKVKAGNLLANGKVVVAGTVKVDFRIMEGNKGLFAGFPSQMSEKEGKKNYYPYIKLVDDATYESFQKEAVAAYEQQMAGTLPVVASASKPVGKTGNNIPF